MEDYLAVCWTLRRTAVNSARTSYFTIRKEAVVRRKGRLENVKGDLEEWIEKVLRAFEVDHLALCLSKALGSTIVTLVEENPSAHRL